MSCSARRTPHLVAQQGEAYRESLIALAEALGVKENVCFIEGFLEQQRLLDYLQATDVYVTPYLNETQITSGTLSYSVALGKPVVSTPLLACGRAAGRWRRRVGCRSATATASPPRSSRCWMIRRGSRRSAAAPTPSGGA